MNKALLLCLVMVFLAEPLSAQSFWRAVDNTAFAQTLTTGIAVHPSTDNLVITTINKGIFRSTDDGASWQQVLATDSTLFTVAASSDGTLFAGGVRGLLFRSQDGGATWSRHQMATTYPVTHITCTAPGTVIAGTGEIEDREGIAYDVGDGVFLSANNGATWTQSTAGLPGNACVTALLAEPAGRLWTAVSNWRVAGNRGGLYYSDNGGATWTFVRIAIDGRGTVPDSVNVRGIEALVRDDAGRLYISLRGAGLTTLPNPVGYEFVARTDDVTKPWEILSVVQSSMFWMQMPLYSLYTARNGVLWGSAIGVTRGGAYHSDGSGTHWTFRRKGLLPALSGRFEKMLFAEQSNGTIYAVQQLDNHVYRADSTTVTDVPGAVLPVAEFGIAPNPVVGSAVVSLVLTHPAQVRLRIVDVAGRETAVPVRGIMGTGAHHLVWDAIGLAAGLYSAVLEIDGVPVARRSVLRVDEP